MSTAIYRTSRTKSATNSMLRNGLFTGVGALLAAWQWSGERETIFAIFAALLAVMCAGIVKTYFNTLAPLEITASSVIVNGFYSSEFPLRNVTGIGEHPVRKTPSLTYHDAGKGHTGEIVLPWMFIAEPQNEVLAAINAAIARAKV